MSIQSTPKKANFLSNRRRISAVKGRFERESDDKHLENIVFRRSSRQRKDEQGSSSDESVSSGASLSETLSTRA